MIHLIIVFCKRFFMSFSMRSRNYQTHRLNSCCFGPSSSRVALAVRAGDYRWERRRVTSRLRHTTASLAISAGANVKVVQRVLGHATAAMKLDLYGHRLDDDLAGVADTLGKTIESPAVSLRYEEEAG